MNHQRVNVQKPSSSDLYNGMGTKKMALLKGLKLAHVRGIFEEGFSVIFHALLLFYLHMHSCTI